MSKPRRTTPAPATAAPAPLPVGGAKSRPGVKASVGTAVAAATLAAVTVLSAPGTAPAPASASVTSRIAGVQEDMARAVALRQVTAEQAAFLENQLVRRIQAGT
ncbi:hypothetical protein [Specibacter sp. RAF43]|uniref:hypothetical protein n=1 Tax=Specibacter sp. RAF43 TaxID=3233057 RepID=UPI003F9C76E8